MCDATVSYKLPENGILLDTLKEPLGKILQEQQLGSVIKKDDVCIAVGDESAVTLHKYNFNLKLAIVDYKTQREMRMDLKEQIAQIGDKVVRVENPAAMITEALWDAIENALNGEADVRIEVEGEEDLATIPCVALAPINTIIVYGMPDQGLVVARIDDETKQLVQKALEQMEKIL